MSIESMRFGRSAAPKHSAVVLPFAKSLPKFGANPASVQNEVRVGLSHDNFAPTSIHQPAGDKTARIVLRTKAELPGFLERSLQAAGDGLGEWASTLLMVHSAKMPMPFAQIRDTVASAAKSLANAITPDTKIDPNGNLFGTFSVKEAEYPPKPTKAERQETDAAVARQNKSRLLAAFKKQLEKVPAGYEQVDVDLPETLPAGVNRQEVLSELAEMAQLNGYNYNQFRSGNPKNQVTRMDVNMGQAQDPSWADDSKAVQEGTALGEAMNLARHLVDSPANPDRTRLIADAAQALQTDTLKVQVRDKQWLQGQNMNMMLSVGDGNAPGFPDNEPRMVEMDYTPQNWDPKTGKTVLLVGKGIVFDTGGTNLKASAENIHNMRGDMAGGAAVIGTLKAIDHMKLQGIRVIGLVPLTENRIGHNATLENRAVVARNGKRVAISNTDAEGRLVLGDALHYGMEAYKPDMVADIATLTGGKVRGLGAQNAVALSGNNRDLMKAADGIEKKDLGRRTAVLPLTQAHHRWVTRDAAKKDGESFADVYNSVGKDDAIAYGVLSKDSPDHEYMLQHSAQGAAFLREHLANPATPWVHYDMAGAEYDPKDAKRGNWEWATGFGVKDLYRLVSQVADGTVKPNAAKTAMVKPFTDEDLENA